MSARFNKFPLCSISSLRMACCFMIAMLSAVPVASAEIPDARQQELVHMLRHDCGSCHGMTMKGGLGPALLPETLAGKSDELLKITILNGRPPTPMPPWRGILSEEEIEWLIDLLRKGLNE